MFHIQRKALFFGESFNLCFRHFNNLVFTSSRVSFLMCILWSGGIQFIIFRTLMVVDSYTGPAGSSILDPLGSALDQSGSGPALGILSSLSSLDQLWKHRWRHSDVGSFFHRINEWPADFFRKSHLDFARDSAALAAS